MTEWIVDSLRADDQMDVGGVDLADVDDLTLLTLAEAEFPGAHEQLLQRHPDGPPAAADASLEHQFHLPGRHDQRTHGRRKIHLDPSNVGLPAQPQSDAADNAAKWHRDLAGFEDLVAGSGDSALSSVELADGQRIRIAKVQLTNGMDALEKTFKPSTGHDADQFADAEMLVGLTGRLIGAPVPRALRTGPDTVVTDLVAGKLGASLWDQLLATNKAPSTVHRTPQIERDQLSRVMQVAVDSPEGKRLGVLDLLTDNWARADPSTWLLDQRGRPVGFSHELAFEQPGNPQLPPAAVDVPIFSQAFAGPDGWKPNDLTAEDVDWLRARVNDLHDDYRAMDRETWWQFMSGRLTVLAEHAQGSTNLFAPVKADASLELPFPPTDRYGSADRGSRRGPVSAVELFHLPGLHDQRTHGRRHVQVGGDPFTHAGPTGHVADAASLWHRDLTDLHGLVGSIETGIVESTELSGGLMGSTSKVKFGDGTLGVVKITQDVEDAMGHGDHSRAETQADSEMLGSLLGRALGARVPRVLRTGPNELYMEYAAGTPWSAYAWHPNADGDSIHYAEKEIADSPEGKRLGLLDLLSDNWDRNNPSNWMLAAEDDEPVGYDHSFLWNGLSGGKSEITSPNGPERPPGGDVIGPFSMQYVSFATGIDWGLNDLTQEDVDWVSARLDDLEDDFAAVARHDWWQFAVDRWDIVKRYANGTPGKNVFAPN